MLKVFEIKADDTFYIPKGERKGESGESGESSSLSELNSRRSMFEVVVIHAVKRCRSKKNYYIFYVNDISEI